MIIKIELNLNEVAEKVTDRLRGVPFRIKMRENRWKRWWFDNQRPRAHVIAEAIHRALHPTVDAGSIGTVDQDTLRTGGGVFGKELGNQAEAAFDGFYGPEATWQHHSKPSLFIRLAGHVVAVIDGGMGIPSQLVRWRWNARDRHRWQAWEPTFIRTEDD